MAARTFSSSNVGKISIGQTVNQANAAASLAAQKISLTSEV
jgi:hypothetical protein